jgi:hypothetical protein
MNAREPAHRCDTIRAASSNPVAGGEPIIRSGVLLMAAALHVRAI